ncbi:hypothetical protein FQN53_007368 [Emmonsiellopsis sp. PD_33]|nr:hypothetical protein FQN53_007368 [Emmonsiellopsis sp. PD_33]
MHPTAFYGPLASQAQLDLALKFLEIGKKAGNIVTGLGGEGSNIQLTIFMDPPKDNPLLKEIIFGPLQVIQHSEARRGRFPWETMLSLGS